MHTRIHIHTYRVIQDEAKIILNVTVSVIVRKTFVWTRVLLWMVLFFNYALQPFKAYCAIWVRRSNFRCQASPRTQRRKVQLWARYIREVCLNGDLHVTFRDLLHAVKLRHGTDGFTSPPKKGGLRIFSPTASAGCEPTNLGTKG
jgi:hypothetical protein